MRRIQPVTAAALAAIVALSPGFTKAAKIARVGAVADVPVPAGATRVSLAGMTVMPMVIDTHVHLSSGRDALVRDLKLRAYDGVSAALSLGTDSYDVLDLRGQTIPATARFLSAGRGITMPEPGRTTAPYWVTSDAEGRMAVEELAARKVDIVKIRVDTRDGKYKRLTPEIYGAGIDAFAHGVRDRDIDDAVVAMLKQRPNLACNPAKLNAAACA